MKTRIAVLHLQASDPELPVLMRRVAINGFEQEGRALSPEKCVEICEYIIDQTMSLHRSLDMRVLVTSLRDYLWNDGESGCH